MRELLKYGAVSSATRVDGTVERDAGPWTPTIHELLRFLHAQHFTYSPVPLGVADDHEVLQYMPGESAVRPWDTQLLTDSGMVQAGRMLRKYHQTVAEFRPSSPTWRIGNVALRGSQIIRHGDLGPWNTLWNDGKLTGLIDWDFAEPGERITDVAQMALYFIPLTGEKGWQESGFVEAPDFHHRLFVLCESYGDFDPTAIVQEVDALEKLELARLQDYGSRGVYPWNLFVEQGAEQEIRDANSWLYANMGDLLDPNILPIPPPEANN